MEFKKGYKVKIGDLHGVVDLVTHKSYPEPIKVTWDDGSYTWFTSDGRFYESHKVSILKLVSRPKQMVKKKYWRALLKNPNGTFHESENLYKTKAEAEYVFNFPELIGGRWVEFEVEE